MKIILFCRWGDIEINDYKSFCVHVVTGDFTFIVGEKEYCVPCTSAGCISGDLYVDVKVEDFQKFATEWISSFTEFQEALATFSKNLKNNPDFFSKWTGGDK